MELSNHIKGSGTMKKQVSFLLALALLLTSCGSGSGTSAATMHLRRAEGTVSVSDGEGKNVEPKEDLGLYSGYGVDTQAESYAWIDLDEVKLTKLDQDSQIEIKKEDKHLEIEVLSGAVFFNVTEPLADDETMNIRTSTMMLGIRGTCGWVALSEDKGTLTVGLLEGKVECSNGEDTATVSAGEKGAIPASGEIAVAPLTAAQVPAFVKAELEEDSTLAETVKADSGLDVLAPIDPMRLRDMYTYSKVLIYNPNGELNQEVEYFPDEQGRIGTTVTHYIAGSGDDVTRYIYNDAGTLQAMSFENGAYYTVTEDTADHRTIEWVRDFDGVLMKYIRYYDEQGRETRQEHVSSSNEVRTYWTYTYDAAGKLIRGEQYTASGALNFYCLYEYD